MKTYKHLFEKICSFENLLMASKNAQKVKRFKSNVLKFNYNLEKNLLLLHEELLNGTYTPNNYRTFFINDPKHRKISAAPYRDRVVHHAICNILVPIWDSRMIYDSYACRKSKGTHKAILRFSKYARGNDYVQKCDVKKFFDSIDHEKLKQLLNKHIKDEQLLQLFVKIIESNNHSVGLPLGNLTSQWFANLYLDSFDHYVKETLRCKCYLRYMDDFVIFSDSKEFLKDIFIKVNFYMDELNLALHENKCQTWPIKQGVDFLGFKIYPTHRVLLKRNVHRVKRRFWYFQRKYKEKSITIQEITRSVASWLGHMTWGDTFRLKNKLLESFVLSRE